MALRAASDRAVACSRSVTVGVQDRGDAVRVASASSPHPASSNAQHPQQIAKSNLLGPEQCLGENMRDGVYHSAARHHRYRRVPEEARDDPSDGTNHARCRCVVCRNRVPVGDGVPCVGVERICRG
jgi:hypothetical protein